MPVERSDGSSWPSARVERFDGSSWPSARVERFDGSSWEQLYPTGPTIIDDFEDGNLAEYTLQASEGGDVPVASTDQSQSGLYALKSSGSGFGDSTWSSMPGDGLNYYPSAGDTISFWHWTSTSSDRSYYWFGAQSHASGSSNHNIPNTYELHLDANNSSLNLSVRTSGSSTQLDSMTFNPPTNQWLEVTVTWGSDGTIQASADGSTVSASDSTFSDGGIGARHTADNTYTIYTDNWLVK